MLIFLSNGDLAFSSLERIQEILYVNCTCEGIFTKDTMSFVIEIIHEISERFSKRECNKITTGKKS